MPVNRAEIAWALSELHQQASRYELFEAYYRGDHRLTFATEKFRNAFGRLFAAFADNLCPVPVDALADRLQVTSFTSEQETIANVAQEIWTANRMDRRSGEIHVGAPKLGDAYLIVWPNSVGEVRMWPQNPANIVVDYDQDEAPDRILRAAKKWRNQEGRIRLNLYFPDRIEKYVSRTVPRQDTEMKPEYFVEYEPEDGSPQTVINPYGVVPVFHFANNAATGEYGRSELADVIPLQDALNKAVADMLVAMEFVALPQRFVTGLQMEVDDQGRPKPPDFVPGADRVWAAPGENIRFGEFQSADLQQFLAVQDGFRVEIARVTGLPVHYVLSGGGTPPSGESLKVAEARLVKKAMDRQLAYGNVWEDAVTLAVRQQLGMTGDAPVLEAVWEDAETRNELLESQTQVLKQQLGVSQQQTLRELGYTQEEIERMAEEKQANQEAFGMAAMMAAARDEAVSVGQGRAALEAED